MGIVYSLFYLKGGEFMKVLLEEHGLAALYIIALLVLIMGVTPIGELVVTSLKDMVTNFNTEITEFLNLVQTPTIA